MHCNTCGSDRCTDSRICCETKKIPKEQKVTHSLKLPITGFSKQVSGFSKSATSAVVKMPRTNTTHSHNQLGTEAIHKQLSDPGKDRPDQALIIPRVLPKYMRLDNCYGVPTIIDNKYT